MFVTKLQFTNRGEILIYFDIYRASARVEVPELVEGDRMQIGWIQTCTEMCFVNAYGSEGM